MNLKQKHILSRIAAIMMTVVAIVSCSQDLSDFTIRPENGNEQGHSLRAQSEIYRNIFIVYSMGFNNISSYLRADLQELTANAEIYNSRDRIIIFSHLRKGNERQAAPVLTELRTDDFGNIICDTLEVFPTNTHSVDAKTVRNVLTKIKDSYPAKSYSILFSSHGTGWAPQNYCATPSSFESSVSGGGAWSVRKKEDLVPKIHWTYPEDSSIPMVKSIGAESISGENVEININDLADNIPMKMDFIIFDACFMGGIEVAYELRNVCDKIVASQTEVIAEGMDYITMTSYLMKNSGPDLEGFCRNYFDYYNNHQQALYRSATISLIDTRKLTPLAEACKEIFESRRSQIAALEGKKIVQPYYQRTYSNLHGWFFDLESIIINSGASQEQLTKVKNALDQCIIYKDATETFFTTEIKIDHHCGLSMYLPYKNRTYLNDFYKSLEWNMATGLVK
jgi:hypothetical protein